MDKTQLKAFYDYMIGGRPVGGAADEPVETPHSPELRAFVIGRVGDAVPPYAHFLIPANRGSAQHAEWAPKSKAIANLLREVADGIDPPENEAVANAHLIAAAPDLLASLKVAVSVLDDGENRPEVDAMLAAITKATQP